MDPFISHLYAGVQKDEMQELQGKDLLFCCFPLPPDPQTADRVAQLPPAIILFTLIDVAQLHSWSTAQVHRLYCHIIIPLLTDCYAFNLHMPLENHKYD